MKWHTMETQNIQAPITHAVGMHWHLPHGTSRELATVGMQWHTLEARNIRGRIAGTCIQGILAAGCGWHAMACLQWHPGTSKDIQQEANLGDMALQNTPHSCLPW